ncbi:MAG: glycoside hydrolase family 38 C-terminal domain-containing protein, partial [Butyricicoccus sp.]
TAADETMRIEERTLENRFFRIILNENGELVSVYDKRCAREVLSGVGNVLTTYEDRPFQYDAWEIANYYREKPYPVNNLDSIRVLETGPVRGGIEITRTFSQSTIRQRIFIYDALDRIDFQTDIDWHEQHLLLKTAFPVNIHANAATYDIPFGNISRPTHRNTSWEEAKFEVCGHKWVDLSEGNYGVAVLNDCKYGHSVRDGVIELTLLKGATFPNEHADQGEHHFTYSLYPHADGFAAGGVQQRAMMLNSPVTAAPAAGSEPCFSMFRIDAPTVQLDTVKCAFDGEGYIVRMFEFGNYRRQAALGSDLPISRAWECDLEEHKEAELPIVDGAVQMTVAPYELKTIRVQFQ